MTVGIVAVGACTADKDEAPAAPAQQCQAGEDACGDYICQPDTATTSSALGEGDNVAQPDGGAAPAPARPTYVSLTFDDTFADQYQLLDLLGEVGMKATFFVNSARVGQKSYMTETQLHDLENAGHEIAGHTVTHPTLPAVDEDEQRRQVCNDRVSLLGMNFKVMNFAYPHGAFSPLTQQIVRDCGYNSARVTGSLGCEGCVGAEPVDPLNTTGIDVYAVRSPTSIKCNTTVDDMKNEVLTAEARGGGWLPMVFHHVCDGCGQNAVSAGKLRQFVAWLGARASRGTTVKTVRDMVGGEFKPGVAGPAAAPAKARTGNLLENPGFEDADPASDDIARCWVKGGEGFNEFDYGRSADAHSGNFSEWLEVTKFTDGARRIYTRQDLGYCSPVIEPGRHYRVSAWYKSTAAPRFTVYYREPSGFWSYWATSKPMPASDGWTQQTFDLPAAPEDASAISVGISLFGKGKLVMDDFAVTDITP